MENNKADSSLNDNTALMKCILCRTLKIIKIHHFKQFKYLLYKRFDTTFC